MKVFILAALIDIAYQWIVLRWVYPFETLFVSFLLACVPYLLIRGPANRIATAWHHGHEPTEGRRP